MMKLYPPVLENKLPAFSNRHFSIPFNLNKAISLQDIHGIVLKIKSVHENKVLLTSTLDKNTINNENNTVTISDLNMNKLTIGQFYKIQIAFVDHNRQEGYYSNTGIAKYIAEPSVYIAELKDQNNILTNSYIYTGCYDMSNTDELLYDYCFNLYDSDKKTILHTTGVMLNENTMDEDTKIIRNFWQLTYNLKPYINYYIEFIGTTLNGFKVSTGQYVIQKQDTINLDIDSDFLAKLDYENGCINISLQSDSKFNSMIKYKFLVSRASSKDNYLTWEPIMKDIKSFNPQLSDANVELEDIPTFHIWTDYTVEQGVSYIYALQAYNDYNIFSNPIYSNRIKIFSQEINELKNLLIQENNIFQQLDILINNEEYDSNLGTQVGMIVNNYFIPFAEKLLAFDNDILTKMTDLSFSMKLGNDIKEHKTQLKDLYMFLKNLEIYIPNEIKDIYGGPNPILADFEHAYLFDGKRQLKLAFNPKISSFKNTILESKVDTLGGKYPFFFRNARIKYKEFPISGLISCFMDEDNKFLTGLNQLQLKTYNANGAMRILDEHIGNTSLTSTNIYKERNFKMEVLEWLTNGEPKIFRSPTEGNFIVRLMNVSLSPNDTLGRMLHTFSATAYEMAEYTFENLRLYNFVDINLALQSSIIQVCQTIISEGSELNFNQTPKYLKCQTQNPWQGEMKIKIKYKNANQDDDFIAFRGIYQFTKNICENIAAISLELSSNTSESIEIIWAYETTAPSNNFNYIQQISLIQETSQFIGGLGRITDTTIQQLPVNQSYQQIDISKIKQPDIIQEILSNIKYQVGKINYLKIYRRHIEDCWYNEMDQTCYTQPLYKTPESFLYADSLIYRVITANGNYMVWRQEPNKYLYITEKDFNDSNPYTVILNDEIISLADNEINSQENLNLLHTLKANLYVADKNDLYFYPITTETTIESTSVHEINRLQVGLGLIVEINYDIKEFNYDINSALKPQNWYDIENDYLDSLKNLKIPTDNYFDRIADYEEKYNLYLSALKDILNNLKYT